MNSFLTFFDELQVVDLDEPGGVQLFEEILGEIFALRLPESIIPLLGFLHDDAQYDELMFSIIHGIEIFPDEIYICEILRGVRFLYERSPRWALIIFMRIINSESTRMELVKQVFDASFDVKNVVKLLMKEINARRPEFLSKTMEIVVASS